MLRAVDNFEGVEAFNYELQVQAAIRSYDRELELIAVERGIKRDSPAYVELRSTIAGFAADNNVSDLRVAYRLMLAECPERLPQPSA